MRLIRWLQACRTQSNQLNVQLLYPTLCWKSLLVLKLKNENTAYNIFNDFSLNLKSLLNIKDKICDHLLKHSIVLSRTPVYKIPFVTQYVCVTNGMSFLYFEECEGFRP